MRKNKLKYLTFPVCRWVICMCSNGKRMETLQSCVKYWYLPNEFHTTENSYNFFLFFTLNLTFLLFLFFFDSLKWRIDTLDREKERKENKIRSENRYGNFFTSVINVIKIYYYYSVFFLCVCRCAAMNMLWSPQAKICIDDTF